MRDKVFVSFDYENDRRYKYLLEAWNDNPEFLFTFQDMSPDEIDSSDVGRVKAALTAKINAATHTFVIVGRYANTPHWNRSRSTPCWAGCRGRRLPGARAVSSWSLCGRSWVFTAP